MNLFDPQSAKLGPVSPGGGALDFTGNQLPAVDPAAGYNVDSSGNYSQKPPSTANPLSGFGGDPLPSGSTAPTAPPTFQQPLSGFGGTPFMPQGPGASVAPSSYSAWLAATTQPPAAPVAPATPTSPKSPASAPAAIPFQGSPGTMGYGYSQVPGMASPTQAPLIGTYLAQILEQAQSSFTSQKIANGTSTAQQEAQNILDKAQNWAMMNPQLAAQMDWKGEATKAAQQYMQWAGGQPMSAFSSGAPATSLTNGAPLPYGYTKTGPQYDASKDPTVANAAALGSWMPGLQGPPAGGGPTPTYNPTPWNPGKAWSDAGSSPGVDYFSGTTPQSSTASPGGSASNPLLDAVRAYLSGGPANVTTTPLGYTSYAPSSGNNDALMALIAAVLGMQQSGAKRTSYAGLF